MTIPESGEIGVEVHDGHDQLRYFVTGSGAAKIGQTEYRVAEGDVSIVPSGTFPNFCNTGAGMLKLFNTYSPSEHPLGYRARRQVRGGCERVIPCASIPLS